MLKDWYSLYGPLASIYKVESDAALVCESCGTNLTLEHELWLIGEVSTCPRCLKEGYPPGEVIEVADPDTGTVAWIIAVNDPAWENGFGIGANYVIGQEDQIFYDINFAHATNDVYRHMITRL